MLAPNPRGWGIEKAIDLTVALFPSGILHACDIPKSGSMIQARRVLTSSPRIAERYANDVALPRKMLGRSLQNIRHPAFLISTVSTNAGPFTPMEGH